ncbi:hypothetical protein CENSYa_1564 [Cenarchaeum symbiosum A]|uniref:Uncharacterized protein n=1 Tax=Cenarchaeum symbiosum (strain A) TaxID=414004 RepID=A0RXW7_CENSY|nr:hypothetical protein CENSYa_1564 [Cenarchaeum symbiosum A]
MISRNDSMAPGEGHGNPKSSVFWSNSMVSSIDFMASGDRSGGSRPAAFRNDSPASGKILGSNRTIVLWNDSVDLRSTSPILDGQPSVFREFDRPATGRAMSPFCAVFWQARLRYAYILAQCISSVGRAQKSLAGVIL